MKSEPEITVAEAVTEAVILAAGVLLFLFSWWVL